jgi:flavin reductase (DIM6/NTAB) family NADH-FMN oxidoreductase RutF
MIDMSDANATLAAALGRIPSGLYVLTAAQADDETGMLASWVQQCSFDPPHVTIAVNRRRDFLEWLSEGAVVVLNIIPEGGRGLVAHFGKGFALGEPAFEGLEVNRGAGIPPILKQAHAYLVCRISNRVEVADHVLLIALVVAGAVLHDGKPTIHVRNNGLRY